MRLFIFRYQLSNELFSRDRRNPYGTTVSDNKCRANEIRIDGIRVESGSKVSYDDDNIPDFSTRTNARLRLFGCGFTDHTVITFTQQVNDREGACLLPASGQFKVISQDLLEYTALVDIVIPNAEATPYYICVKNAEEGMGEKVRTLFSKIFLNNKTDFNFHNFSDKCDLYRKSAQPYHLYIRALIAGCRLKQAKF